MGTKREYDSGRRDTLGRKIKIGKLFGRDKRQENAPDASGSVFRIAEEFSDSVQKAAHYGIRGDEQNFRIEREKAHKLYTMYKHLDHLTEDIPTKKKKYAEWRENYENFRRFHGLDAPKGAPLINVDKVPYNRNYTQGVDAEIGEAIREAASIIGTAEEVQAYRDAIRKQKEKTTSATSTTPQSAQPEEPEVIDGEVVSVEPDIVDAEVISVEPDTSNEQKNTTAQGKKQDSTQQKTKTKRNLSDNDKSNRRAQARKAGGFLNEPGDEEEIAKEKIGENIHGEKRAQERARFGTKNYGSQANKTMGNPFYDSEQFEDATAEQKTRSKAKSRDTDIFSSFEKGTGLAKHGSFRPTFRPTVGPFVFNAGRKGLSSVSLRLGAFRFIVWDRDRRTGFSSLDLPGGMSFRGKREKKE